MSTTTPQAVKNGDVLFATKGSKPTKPLQLLVHNTANGQKVPILIEELGLNAKIINFNPFEPNSGIGEKNLNGKIPHLTDPNVTSKENKELELAESGAILMHLAETYGSGQFYPPESDRAGRALVQQWLFFQMASVGPMFGQVVHFARFAPPEEASYGKARYVAEAQRILGVIEKQLSSNTYIAGSNYSIADIAIWPWISAVIKFGFVPFTKETYPNMHRWYTTIEERPAVQRASLSKYF